MCNQKSFSSRNYKRQIRRFFIKNNELQNGRQSYKLTIMQCCSCDIPEGLDTSSFLFIWRERFARPVFRISTEILPKKCSLQATEFEKEVSLIRKKAHKMLASIHTVCRCTKFRQQTTLRWKNSRSLQSIGWKVKFHMLFDQLKTILNAFSTS